VATGDIFTNGKTWHIAKQAGAVSTMPVTFSDMHAYASAIKTLRIDECQYNLLTALKSGEKAT
jgi:hypothetical protein